MNRSEIYTLSNLEVSALIDALAAARRGARMVTVTVDGGLKVKVGAGMWTPPLGQPTYPVAG